uniref:Uncharacterized protein n=1 Tax=Candidozyma auris TaxID=498019 RepID=A0A0L0NYH1_CANAR
MSLFRSLQNSPATISIFHNARVPALARLFAFLEKAYYQLNDDKNLFQLDMNAKQMPTYDQFKSIYTNCVRGDRCKTVLKECFPLLNDKFIKSDQGLVTVKSLGISHDRGFKIFSQNEYDHIHETFDNLINQENPEIDPNELFQPPLLIDWDQNLIANDMDGLELILAKYKEAAKEKS